MSGSFIGLLTHLLPMLPFVARTGPSLFALGGGERVRQCAGAVIPGDACIDRYVRRVGRWWGAKK